MAEAATGGATGIGGLAQVDTGGMTTTEHGWVRFPDQAGHADAAGSGGDDGRGSCWGQRASKPARWRPWAGPTPLRGGGVAASRRNGRLLGGREQRQQ